GRRATGSEQDAAAAGLRWYAVQGAESRVSCRGCWSSRAFGLAGSVARPESQTSLVFGTGVRSAGQLDQAPSHRVLVPWRREQPTQHAPALLLPPSPCA